MANHIIEVFLFCLNTVPRNLLLCRWVERRRDREEVQEDRPLPWGMLRRERGIRGREGDSERLTLQGSHLVHVGSRESYAKWLHFNRLEGLSAEVPPWEKERGKT